VDQATKKISKALKEDFNIDFHGYLQSNLPIAPILDYLIALTIT
jgi:hypothetical protein